MFEAIRAYGPPRAALDRAVMFTESFKETENQPLVVRWAKAEKHYAEKAQVAIFPDELIARCTAGTEKFQTDPHSRDCILFHEYFHGDNGADLGASHQTEWTGVVAPLMHLFTNLTPDRLREGDTTVRPGESGDGGGQRPLNVESTKATRR